MSEAELEALVDEAWQQARETARRLCGGPVGDDPADADGGPA